MTRIYIHSEPVIFPALLYCCINTIRLDLGKIDGLVVAAGELPTSDHKTKSKVLVCASKDYVVL